MTFLTLTERIELEQRSQNPKEVKELNLDNSKATEIEGLSDFVNLETLSLANVGLVSLKGLPTLQSLKNLELSNNRLVCGLEALENCPMLEQLNLSGNNIKSIESLSPLSKLKHLRNLDLLNCEVTNCEHYRSKLFNMMPSLKYLDGFDVNDEEEPAGEDVNGSGVQGEEGENEGPEPNEGDDEEYDDDDEDDDDEEEEEIGIEALRDSKDLEDDEEDYAPDDDDEDLDDDLSDEDDVDEEDTGANLSGAGVTGPRRPSSKRRHSDKRGEANGDDYEPSGKHKAVDNAECEAEEPISNGAATE